jgi:dihydroxyacetone kinase-like protein
MISSALLHQWFEHTAAVLEENKLYLTELDSAIGDADHGANIARGFAAVVARLSSVKPDGDAGALLKMAGMTLMSTVGGASGLLYGNFFLKAATMTAGKGALSAAELAEVVGAGVEAIAQRGRAVVGDKTMIDAWRPAVDALRQALAGKQELVNALRASVVAAEEGMKDTIPLQARKGRASYLGERSIGHQDPGATSAVLILRSLLAVVERAQ